MNILCVIDNLGCGGAQRQLVELGLGFKEKGHYVVFLTYHYLSFFDSVVEKAEISITCIQEPNYLKRLLKMRRFIRKGKFDAVLSFLEAPNFICEMAGLPYRNWKLVVGERNANPEITKSFKLKMYRWFHILADYIVCNSSSNLKLVRRINRIIPEKKCKVIFNIINFNYWKPIAGFSCRKSSKLNLVIPASLTHKKNLIGLVEALLLLDESDRGRIKIDWYGYMEEEADINGSVSKALKKIETNGLENIINIHPATHDIRIIIQESDAIGLFSLYEGLPNALCEGMACGKPVICSAVSDLTDLLSYDSNLLFDPYNPQSIKQTLSYLISLSNDQLSQIGLKNKIIAKEMFNREIIISDYLKLLSA